MFAQGRIRPQSASKQKAVTSPQSTTVQTAAETHPFLNLAGPHAMTPPSPTTAPSVSAPFGTAGYHRLKSIDVANTEQMDLLVAQGCSAPTVSRKKLSINSEPTTSSAFSAEQGISSSQGNQPFVSGRHSSTTDGVCESVLAKQRPPSLQSPSTASKTTRGGNEKNRRCSANSSEVGSDNSPCIQSPVEAAGPTSSQAVASYRNDDQGGYASDSSSGPSATPIALQGTTVGNNATTTVDPATLIETPSTATPTTANRTDSTRKRDFSDIQQQQPVPTTSPVVLLTAPAKTATKSTPSTVTSTTSPKSAETPTISAEIKPTKGKISDVGSVIKTLLCYESFTFDAEQNIWVVADEVLAKCFEFIRSVGYQRAFDPPPKARTLLTPLWCPSATVSSPLSPQQQIAFLQQQQNGTNNNNNAAAPLGGKVLSPTLFQIPKSPDNTVPPPPVGTAGPQVFLETEEGFRWLAEQEYVIGTILLCCAFEPISTKSKSATQSLPSKSPQEPTVGQNPTGAQPQMPTKARKQFIPPHVHPVKFVASHVLQNFPHWGDIAGFRSLWDAQTRVVLGTAAPSHQRSFHIQETGITFHSDMECGNLQRVQRHVMGGGYSAQTTVYLLWIEGDCQSDKRLWFRYAVSGLKEREPLCMRIMNIAPNSKLYRNGMKPVWRAGQSQLQWRQVDDYNFSLSADEKDGELSFYIVPKVQNETIHVAFCVPYSYGDLLCHITQWHSLVKKSACNIRFEERVLCRTPDERKLHLLIVTSQTDRIGGGKNGSTSDVKNGKALIALHEKSGSMPYSSFSSGKKVVLISGRVHPGEVTASHALHGLVTFLLSSDSRASALREHFIFFIVPMLNPDGVARGHSRLDQHGFNLNRCYNEPNPTTQPTVHSLRNVFDHLQANFKERFFLYIDFHSHASQQAGFIFGNHLPSTVQHWNMLVPKIIESHAPHLFDFETCRFGKHHMTTKEGTSRVLFGGSLIHSYTVELTHFTDGSLEGGYLCAKPRMPSLGSFTGSPATGLPSSNTVVVTEDGKVPVEDSSKTTETKRSSTVPSPPPPAQTPTQGAAASHNHTILSQSATIGRACVLGLLDYCAIGEPSAAVLRLGGVDRILREVKREIRGGPATGVQRPSSYNIQTAFKQY